MLPYNKSRWIVDPNMDLSPAIIEDTEDGMGIAEGFGTDLESRAHMALMMYSRESRELLEETKLHLIEYCKVHGGWLAGGKSHSLLQKINALLAEQESFVYSLPKK